MYGKTAEILITNNVLKAHPQAAQSTSHQKDMFQIQVQFTQHILKRNI